ncbi:TniB family NTP-binding protein [Gordonia sp. NPDC003950]
MSANDIHISRPLSPYSRADLGYFPRRIGDMTEPPSARTDEPDTVARWIRGIGPIETSDIEKIHRAIIRLLAQNSQSPAGSRQWLAIDGPPLMGKSSSAIVAALRVSDWLCEHQSGDVRTPFTHIPVIIVSGNLGHTPLARTLLDNIARFIGVALPANLRAAIAALDSHLRNVGALLVVVDDAHFIKRQGGSRNLTDDLKDILTSLTVSFVFVGAGLRSSALLHVPNDGQVTARKRRTRDTERPADELRFQQDQYSAVEQLRWRMTLLALIEQPATADGAPDDVFIKRMSSMVTQLERIDGFDPKYLRTESGLKLIFQRARGRTGIGFKIISLAAAVAAELGTAPSHQHVRAVLRMSDTEITSA